MLKPLSTSTLSPTKGPGFQAECRAGNQATNQTGNQAGNRAGNQATNQTGNQARSQAECQTGNHAGNHAGNQAGNRAGNQAGNDARALPLENFRCEMRQVDTPVLPDVTARGFHILIWVALFIKVVAVGLVEIVEEVC